MVGLAQLSVLLLTAAIASASPLEGDAARQELQARASAHRQCSATLRHRNIPRGIPFLDAVADAEAADLEKRVWARNAQCNVCGPINPSVKPLYSLPNTSWQRCADYCKCALNHYECKTFNWEEYPSMPGLGTCNIYNKNLKRLELQPGTPDDSGPFYERNCFKKTHPQPPPHQTTKPGWPSPTGWPHHTPTPWAAAPVKRDESEVKAKLLAKRTDTDEKFWALVLAET